MSLRVVTIFYLCISGFLTTGAIFAQKVDMSLWRGVEIRNIGPAGMSGRVTAIDVIKSNPKIILIGTAAGGVWKSENQGYNWDPIFDNTDISSIGSISIYQKNPNIIYVGTGEGNPRNSQNGGRGVYKTIDGGKSWVQLGLQNTRQIHRIIVHPGNPKIVYVGASGPTWTSSEERGIYKSVDGGSTWQKILYVDSLTGCADLIMDPTNPNKLIAAMWTHSRKAWRFSSGGQGSGIFLTYDGGTTWQRIVKDNGIPEKPLGRIGLAMAPSNPEIVYAYIESRENAIFKSEDGGHHWVRQSKPGDRLIGGRPFYYADIYVDTKNENRIYSLATEVTVSEDGGKTWHRFAPGNKIHTDHHAWWSHPDDPDYLIVGHDGGLSVTQDRGKNWFFPDNLPLGQFYHIRVDNAIPYNIYGGLQDNGSWRGPSQTWFKGGIRNMYWQRLSVGDGFDMLPDPLNPEYGYAMGQAGGLIRYHYPSGQLLPIKPIHPEGKPLRFNWNAGLAINEVNQKTIYYGSQFVHKSEDYGKSWQVISPDLSTNNPDKQDFLETGGLTYDVTGAEFHTTIISIAPSYRDENIIWVGTDDGLIHITTDHGMTWNNLTPNIIGVPKNTWIPHIKASYHNPAEAFVVLDDHRRGSWEPYILHTRDYGESWEKLSSKDEMDAFVYCIEQDPVVPNLLFAGTETGLYLSFDYGKNWNKWNSGFPSIPVRDLIVHRRDHDLIIGTFGRSIWILDNLLSLREIATQGWNKIHSQSLVAFPTPDAYLAVIGESIGYRHGKVGDALFEGTNRAYGALITYFVDSVKVKNSGFKVPISIAIHNQNDQIMTTFEHMPIKGFNRVNWNLSRDGIRFPGQSTESTSTSRAGIKVPPDRYKIMITYEGDTSITNVNILSDPRLNISTEEYQIKESLLLKHQDLIAECTKIADKIYEIEKDLQWMISKLKDSDYDSLRNELISFKKSLLLRREKLLGGKKQGIYRNPNTITSVLNKTSSILSHLMIPSSPNQEAQLKIEEEVVSEFLGSFESFLETKLKPLINMMNEVVLKW